MFLLGEWLIKTTHPGQTTVVNYLHELSDKRGPSKECGSDRLPPTGRIWERLRVERRFQSVCPTNLQNPSHWNPFDGVMHVPPGRTLSQSDWSETTQKLNSYRKA